jgi:hypothetical protein
MECRAESDHCSPGPASDGDLADMSAREEITSSTFAEFAIAPGLASLEVCGELGKGTEYSPIHRLPDKGRSRSPVSVIEAHEARRLE